MEARAGMGRSGQVWADRGRFEQQRGGEGRMGRVGQVWRSICSSEGENVETQGSCEGMGENEQQRGEGGMGRDVQVRAGMGSNKGEALGKHEGYGDAMDEDNAMAEDKDEGRGQGASMDK